MNAGELIGRYFESWYESFMPGERTVTPAERTLASAEFEQDPLAALAENIDECRRALDATRKRLTEARFDGLFDRDAYRVADMEQRKAWRTCISILRCDYARAIAELAHWRSYFAWAQTKQIAERES